MLGGYHLNFWALMLVFVDTDTSIGLYDRRKLLREDSFNHPTGTICLNAIRVMQASYFFVLLRLVRQDIAVTSIQNGHGAAAEQLTAGGAEFDLQAKGLN
jgi:hypothetical protein